MVSSKDARGTISGFVEGFQGGNNYHLSLALYQFDVDVQFGALFSFELLDQPVFHFGTMYQLSKYMH